MPDRMSTSACKLLSRFSRCTSSVAMAFGVMVLSGWTFHIQRLKWIIPGQVAVKANAAVCFLLIGLALWLALTGPKKPIAQALSRWLALAASMVGLLSFLEFLYGWDFGIDQLLFSAGPEDLPGSLRPGLMSPIAAADFFLLGITIPLLDIRGWRSHLTQSVLGSVVAITCAFGILDFVLDPGSTHTYISPFTALVLFLFSFAVLCARTDWGLGGLLVSITPGGELARRLLPAAVLLPLAVGWLRWKGQQSSILSNWMGIAVMIVSAGVLLSVLTLWTASVLDRIGQARLRAEESAQRLAAIVMFSNDGIIGKTLDGIVTSWNRGAETIYGYSAEEMIGQSVARVIPPDLLHEFQGFLQMVREGQTIRHYETERIRKDGKRIWVSLSISLVEDEQGNEVGASTIVRDISERKQAEAALRQSEERFQAMVNGIPQLAWMAHADGHIFWYNQRWFDYTGTTLEQMEGWGWQSVHDPAFLPRVLERWKGSISSGSPFDMEFPLRGADGVFHMFLTRVQPFQNAEGKVVLWFGTNTDISDLKQAQDALQHREERIRLLLDSTAEAIVGEDLSGYCTFCNPATARLLGYDSGDELVGKNMHELMHHSRSDGSQFPAAVCPLTHALQTGQHYHADDLTFWRSDGTSFPAECWVHPLYDSGSVTGSVMTFLNITNRKQAEQELRLSRERLALSLKAGHAGTFDWDIQNNVNNWTPEVEALHGLAPGEFDGKYEDWEALVVPEDLSAAKDGIETSLKTGEFAGEWRIRRRNDDQIRWIIARAKVLFDESGKPSRMIGVNMDVTERKQTEAALQDSEQNFRTLANSVPQLVWMCTPDGLNVYFNQRWVEYTGLTLEESYGRGWNTPFHPDDKQPAWNAWNHAVTTGDIYRIDCRLRAADESYRWFLIRGVPLHNGKGDIVKWFGTCTDIDDAKQAEAQIARHNALLNAVNSVFREALLSEDESRLWRKCLAMAENLTSSKFGFIDQLNADGRLDSLALSDPGWDQCKMPAEQASLLLKNIAVRGIYAPVIRERRSVLTNDPAQCPEWFGLPEGHPPLTAFLGVPLKQGDTTIGIIGVGNKPNGYVGADREDLETLAVSIVEALMRKRAETQVRRLNEELELRVVERTAQLESANKELEAFTYSVSHDLRAPLRHISGFSKMLSEEFSESLPPDAQHHVQRIQEGTRRMGQLVDDLLNLGRVGRKELSLQVSGLRSIVDEVIESLKSDIGDRQVEWKVGDLPYVECDTALIHQVLQNLLSNALKFTRPRAHALIEIGQEQRDGNSVVYVRDNGVGFSMKYADKLFGVFQRLHRAEDFEGTGVGLATVQRIIQKHGGRIWAEAELDKGASFYFTLGSSQSSEANFKAMAAGEKS